MTTGYTERDRGEYVQAIERFSQVRDPEVTPKYFMHWMWLRMAELESGNVWLMAGNISKARAEADNFIASALSTADPHLQSLAWELHTRVAMAEHNWKDARESIEKALAIVDRFEVLVAAWQVHATASEVYRHLKENKTAETHQERAASCIREIADSFAPEEPMRVTFLSAPPVARALGTPANKHRSRPTCDKKLG